MPTITKGSFSLDLKLFKLETELSDEDRQCAWEFYAELATRVALVGKRGDKTAASFEGELYAENFESLFNFFREARSIMRRFPVGRMKNFSQEHLGVFINRCLANVIRPFLEKWRGKYFAWYTAAVRSSRSPYEVQKEFPDLKEMLEDWTALRFLMRRAEQTVAKQYKLISLD
jgi:hypothetical protein